MCLHHHPNQGGSLSSDKTLRRRHYPRNCQQGVAATPGSYFVPLLLLLVGLSVNGFVVQSTASFLSPSSRSLFVIKSRTSSSTAAAAAATTTTTTKPRKRLANTIMSLSGNGGDDGADNDGHRPGKESLVYDLIVIGGGSAGLTAAKFAGGTLQKSVVILEKDKLGGDCTWTGCVPSKSMIASAKASLYARRQVLQTSSPRRGGGGENAELRQRFSQVKERYKRHQLQIYDADDSPEALEKFGVETISGTARFLSPSIVELTRTKVVPTETTIAQQNSTIKKSAFDDYDDFYYDDERNTSETNYEEEDDDDDIVEVVEEGLESKITIAAREGIVICTGASPIRPDISGLETINYVTYEEVWDLQEFPTQLTVVGGGPIGCELAQAFARLGSQVTIVADRLLPREETEVSEILEEVFFDEGITIVRGRATHVSPSLESTSLGTNAHHLTCTDGYGELTYVTGDTLLVSVGRRPNVEDMGLESIGVNATAEKGIHVNDKLQTSVRGIYAAGDCTGDRQFTHYAGYQGATAARNILLPLLDPGVLSKEAVPSATFTSPEVASIGYTEMEARDQFGDTKIEVISKRLDTVDRAICSDETKGIIKIVLCTSKGWLYGSSETIVGATIMAPSAGEMIAEIAVAMKAGMSLEQLAQVVHPYPTYSIAIQLIAADWYYEKIKKSLWLYNLLKQLGL